MKHEILSIAIPVVAIALLAGAVVLLGFLFGRGFRGGFKA